jgi:hypothetical protein
MTTAVKTVARQSLVSCANGGSDFSFAVKIVRLTSSRRENATWSRRSAGSQRAEKGGTKCLAGQTSLRLVLARTPERGLLRVSQQPLPSISIFPFRIIVVHLPTGSARDIHDRMPVIYAPADFDRWLSDEPDPRDLRPYPADLMRMWPVSTRANKPANDDSSIIEAVELSSDAA